MKNRILKILGVGLTLALLASLMVSALPVTADQLEWDTESGMPSTSTTSNHLVAGSNVADLAVADDDTTIYAVLGTNNFAYKSTDKGKKWNRLSKDFGFSPDLVAVAPDDSTLAVVADAGGNNVWVTTNGGSTWTDLALTGMAQINDLAISSASAGVHYIAAAGIQGGAGVVQYFNLGSSVPSWTAASGWGGFAGAEAVWALAFSPAFASDKVMVAVSENATTTNYEIASFSSKLWNTTAGFTSYPVALANITLAAADIALAPTYLGADEAERLAFVTEADGSDGGALYRLSDTTLKNLRDTTDFHSVAYDGTNLVAGEYGSNIVRRSADPLATTPTVSSTTTYQRPGGASKVTVAWAGADVVAGTQGNESAFALSKDNGKSFNDLSLIDTAMTNINDVQVSADGSKVYLISDDTADLSLWRKASSWERVLSLAGKTGHIVRIAPEDAGDVYVCPTGTAGNMYYSSDSGEVTWMLRALPAAIVDLAVESAEVAYALTSGGSVYKTDNAGFIWGSAKNSGISSAATIVSLSEDNLIVGPSGGDKIAYCTDGNASSDTWETITSAPFSSGSVQVAADGLADDNYVYAASSTASQNVVRWKLGSSSTWSDIISGTVTGSASGLMLHDGILWVLSYNTSDNSSWVARKTSPGSATSSSSWASMQSTGDLFNKTPSALRISTGSAKIWAIDDYAAHGIDTDTADKLYTVTDDVVGEPVSSIGPAAAYVLAVNPVSGYAADMVFSWSRLSLATEYKLEISYDSAFLEDVTTVTKPSTSSTVVVVVGPSQTGDAQVTFTPGKTYYWRVKASQPMESGYSEARNFSVQEATVSPPVTVTIQPPAPAPTITIPPAPPAPPAPTITVPPAPTITVPPAQPPAQITPAWIWAIVVIGAVLVIAVIILIVRTRRVV
jgi:hypothetical protein